MEKPFGKKLRPVYQSATLFGGEKLDLLGAATVDLEISCCLLQQDILVVRNIQQPVILGWDALLQTGVTINCSSGIAKLENYGIELNLLKKSGTLQKPCLSRCKETIMAPPRSEIGLMVNLQNLPSERSFQKVDGIVDPSSVLPNEDGL